MAARPPRSFPSARGSLPQWGVPAAPAAPGPSVGNGACPHPAVGNAPLPTREPPRGPPPQGYPRFAPRPVREGARPRVPVRKCACPRAPVREGARPRGPPSASARSRGCPSVRTPVRVGLVREDPRPRGRPVPRVRSSRPARCRLERCVYLFPIGRSGPAGHPSPRRHLNPTGLPAPAGHRLHLTVRRSAPRPPGTNALNWAFAGASVWPALPVTAPTPPELTPARYLRDVRVITVKVGQF